MRFLLTSLFWIGAVGLFMPDGDQRDQLIPEIRLEALSAQRDSGQGKALCERAESLCQAASESEVLAEIAGAAAKSLIDKAVQAYHDKVEDESSEA